MPDNTSIHPAAADSEFSSTEEIIADIKAGKMVIMVDDDAEQQYRLRVYLYITAVYAVSSQLLVLLFKFRENDMQAITDDKDETELAPRTAPVQQDGRMIINE